MVRRTVCFAFVLLIIIISTSCEKKEKNYLSSIKDVKDSYGNDQEKIKKSDGKIDYTECTFDDFPEMDSFYALKYEPLSFIPAKDALEYMMCKFKELGLDYIKEEDIHDTKRYDEAKGGFSKATDTVNAADNLDREKSESYGEDAYYSGMGFSYHDKNVSLLIGQNQVYRFDDGRASKYMNNKIKPDLTADGPNESECSDFIYRTAFSDDMVYELADCKMSVSEAAEISESFFNTLEDPYPLDENIKIKAGEIWVYDCGENKAFYVNLFRTYKNIPFLCGTYESGGFNGKDYLKYDILGANITDSSGVCGYVGMIDRGWKLVETGEKNTGMLSLLQVSELLESDLASYLKIKMDEAGLYYAKVVSFPDKLPDNEDVKNSDDIINRTDYRLYWVFKGENQNERSKIKIYVDAVTGDIFMDFPHLTERDERIIR